MLQGCNNVYNTAYKLRLLIRLITVETRTAGTSTQQTTTTTNDTYRVVGTITATSARAVTNAGLFDASSGGNLFVKSDFSTINLATNDQLQLTFNVQFTAA